jgi:hypothetical protein
MLLEKFGRSMEQSAQRGIIAMVVMKETLVDVWTALINVFPLIFLGPLTPAKMLQIRLFRCRPMPRWNLSH